MTRLPHIIALLGLLSLAACEKKTDGDPDTPGSGVLVAGKGLRKIYEISLPNKGFTSGLGTADLMAAPDGTLDWTFGFYSASGGGAVENIPYRRRLTIATGAVVPGPDFPTSLPPSYASGPGYCFYVPYTTNLYWAQTASIAGESPALPWAAPGGWKVYANGQVFGYNATAGYNSTSSSVYQKSVSARYRQNGAIVNTDYVVRHFIGLSMIRCMDMELNMAGEPLMFLATGDSIQVRRYRDNVLLTGIGCTALSRPYTSPITPRGKLTTLRSADGNRITGWVSKLRPGAAAQTIHNTTFVYDVTTNVLQLRLNAAQVGDGQLPVDSRMVSDEEGNVYYPEVDQTLTPGADYFGRIMKQTPAGKAALCSQFLRTSSGSVEFLKAVNNKLYVVLHQGENSNAAAGSRQVTSVLTVVE